MEDRLWLSIDFVWIELTGIGCVKRDKPFKEFTSLLQELPIPGGERTLLNRERPYSYIDTGRVHVFTGECGPLTPSVLAEDVKERIPEPSLVCDDGPRVRHYV